ncbi:MAG: RNA polymerase Rpb4 family protein [Thermoplasmatota archaeon]
MRIVSLAEVKNMLTALSKEREDMTREQKIALEHAEKVVHLSAEKTRELVRQLREMEKLKKRHAYKIADLLPRDEEEVMMIFAKETVVPTKEEAKKIVSLVDQYR